MHTTASGSSTTTPLVFWLDPLPDFLADHTLLSKEHGPRLAEVVSRWVQFVGSLWSWANRATFALRYVSRNGETRIFLLARPWLPDQRQLLQVELEVLLRAYGISFRVPPDAATAARTLAQSEPGGLTLTEVTQFETRTFWSPDDHVTREEGPRNFPVPMPADEFSRPRLHFPWWAPGGPFLVPMESLVSYGLPVTLSIYLEPTILQPVESTWLAHMARLAQTQAEQHRQQVGSRAGRREVDPSASLAGRLYMANLRRLTEKPFLVSVQCGASDGRADVANSLAGIVQALLQETPFDRPQQDESRLPSAAAAAEYPARIQPRLLRQHTELRFAPDADNGALGRMRYLVDARGASTVFRLPVSVNAGVPGVSVQQRSPDYLVGPRRSTPGHQDEIPLGRLQNGGVVGVARDDLTKHVLVTGFTGSGKTMTVLNMLHRLWDHRSPVPWLVIESAKHEYRGLLGVPAFQSQRDGLQVFTAGNEACAPLRLNPFELLPGVRLETHLGHLQTCFEAALPPFGPLTSMIYEALTAVYEECGWRFSDVGVEEGELLPFPFPDMTAFATKMEAVIEGRKYEGEVRSNVLAAVLGRLKPLATGGRGRMFRADHALVPGAPRPQSRFAMLLKRPTVLELNDLTLEDKALVSLFVLALLREHREVHPSPGGKLAHVTVVEEAHNILENVESRGASDGAAADTRYRAVQAFSQMLSEVRALGEGLVIIDQSPEKLAPDAMRNTNLQIAHQLRDSKDREAIARAMIMDDEQRDFLGKLEPGHAAVFRTGFQKATFLKAPPYHLPAGIAAPPGETVLGAGFRAQSDREVAARMAPVVSSYREGPFGELCASCRSRCEFRRPLIMSPIRRNAEAAFRGIYERFKAIADPIPQEEYGQLGRRVIARFLAESRVADTDDSRWCAFLHLWHSARSSTEVTLAPEWRPIFTRDASA